MNDNEWKRVTGFSPKENWGDPYRMSAELIFTLAAWKKYINRTIIVICGYEEREEGGEHPFGVAADVYAMNMSLFDQFISASRFPNFRGIGLYLWWKDLNTGMSAPGLHLDTRYKKRDEPRSLWGSTSKKIYVSVTKEFLYGAL